MRNLIKAKKSGAISHVEVRSEILRAPGTKQKAGAETTPMTGGGGPRDAGRVGQARKYQQIVHPYSTDLEGFLNKPSKDAGNPSLVKICDYCGVTSKQLLPDLEKQDFRQFLVGMRMFGKSCKFNHCTSIKQQVATIK